MHQALTHRSYANECPEQGGDNERLEFLGDAVLGFLVTALLYQRYPNMKEGDLSRLRSQLINEKQLAILAKNLNIGDKMRLGKGVQNEGGRKSPALLSDAFEAILGAYFLDSGIDDLREFVDFLFTPVADDIVLNQSRIDPKTRFQQWAQKHRGNPPNYQILAESGPDHAKEFTAQVLVDNKVYGVGKDSSKQGAEKRAAEAALLKLGLV